MKLCYISFSCTDGDNVDQFSFKHCTSQLVKTFQQSIT